MKHVKLAYRNGAIKDLFDTEVEKRLRAEYSSRREKEILRNMMADIETALVYLTKLKEIKETVKNEIETALGETVDVGFDADIASDNIGFAGQSKRAMQMMASNLTEEQAAEVPSVFPAWEIGRTYTAGTMLRYGINSVGDPQLYRVVSWHTSQADWTPDATASLYTPIGLDDDGYPVWSRPTGAHDAYNEGDVVSYNGILYVSLIDGNVYSPEEYKDGWGIYA